MEKKYSYKRLNDSNKIIKNFKVKVREVVGHQKVIWFAYV